MPYNILIFFLLYFNFFSLSFVLYKEHILIIGILNQTVAIIFPEIMKAFSFMRRKMKRLVSHG